MKTVNQQLTPLEKLLADKQYIQETCQKKEKQINNSFIYIQENAGSLLLSGLSSLLTSTKSTKKTDSNNVTEQSPIVQSETPNVSLNASDYLMMGKAMLPVVWSIVQPIAISWCVRSLRKRITNLFFGPQKAKNKKTKN